MAASKSKKKEIAKKVKTIRLWSLLILAVLAVAAFFIIRGSGKSKDTMAVTHVAEIQVKDMGTITVELYGNLAPRTVKNFVGLAESGFYDGLTFHRIMEGFMMQGGDPLGNGRGGSDENIIGEFAANGLPNDLSHTRGVMSMARAGNDYNSASSQFFIMHQDYPGLDGNYAAFGKVTSGMDIVDRICEEAKPIDNNGTILPEEQPVIETIRIIEK